MEGLKLLLNLPLLVGQNYGSGLKGPNTEPTLQRTGSRSDPPELVESGKELLFQGIGRSGPQPFQDSTKVDTKLDPIQPKQWIQMIQV